MQLAIVADTGPKSVFGADQRSKAIVSVDEEVIRRELAFNEGDLYQLSRITESQRRIYGLELFQFVNITPRLPEDRSPQVPVVVTVAEGKHRRLQLAAGYGSEEKARGAHQLAPREFRRRRADRRDRGEGVVARAGRSRQLHRAVSVSAGTVAAAVRIDMVGARAGLRVPQQRRPPDRLSKDFSRAGVGAERGVRNQLSFSLIREYEDYAISQKQRSPIRRFATS